MNFSNILTKIFADFLAQDEILLESIANSNTFSFESGEWRFSLSELYHFLQKTDQAFEGLSYQEFKQKLYSSSINRDLSEMGGEVVVVDNKRKVEASTYALRFKK